MVTSRSRLALPAIVTAGFLLRFPTLDQQSFWFDEAITHWLVTKDLTAMLDSVTESEQTPFLYYLAEWGWRQLWGAGEVGLRSLSALCGIAAIPIAYLAGLQVGSRRVGLISALLVATNPLLVWYSQEARSYALVVPLVTAGLLFFLRSLKSGRRMDIAGWTGFSLLALATHYFAAFVILTEAVWLLVARRDARGMIVAALGCVGTLAVIQLPLAMHQRCHGRQFDDSSLLARAVRVPKQYFMGLTLEDGPVEAALALVGVVACVMSAWLLVSRLDRHERGITWRVASVGAFGIALPIALAAAGFNYVNTRNLVVALPPLLVAVAVVAGALRASRAGRFLAGAITLAFLAAVATVFVEPRFQREDWRGIAASVAPQREQVMVVTPGYDHLPFQPYLHSARELPAAGVITDRIVVAALPVFGDVKLKPPLPRGTPAPLPPVRGFRLVDRRDARSYTVLTYQAGAPRLIKPRTLRGSALDARQPPSFLQYSPGSPPAPTNLRCPSEAS